MEIILSQPYIKVIRSIEDNQQKSIEVEDYLHLYADQIITDSNVFLLREVHDISYKIFSNSSGFLYLHTNKGVYSFIVYKEPYEFIDMFKELK
ncbi:hypothetical protein SM124_18830 [Bacillus sp. 31A1R]|uniref:Uncharacterized protein n=1 Tax=Robertmurraya mangrovi TaxID=3098077 RepID=A0ABU5J341_9BACI|nr:hypothetical protein [Bacillus sp. 31A1R]MDZ5473777.1 hypothetical protein [Bacillus sp. 31A1R]